MKRVPGEVPEGVTELTVIVGHNFLESDRNPNTNMLNIPCVFSTIDLPH